MDAADAARAHEADADGAAHASVPPTVVAPTARCATQTARSRGPTLRAPASKRSSSSGVSPTRISPSRTPIVAGTAPASRRAVPDSAPTATPSPGGKPCAISVVSSATTRAPRDLVGDTDHGIAPICATQPRGRVGRELGAADEKPGRERVTGPGGVHDGHVACLAPLHVAAADDVESRRASFDHPRLADVAELVPLLRVPEDHIRSEQLEALAEPRRTVRADSRPRRQVDAQACAVACARARRHAQRPRRSARRAVRSRRCGDSRT
jgi:hypothetical protein